MRSETKIVSTDGLQKLAGLLDTLTCLEEDARGRNRHGFAALVRRGADAIRNDLHRCGLNPTVSVQ